MEQQGAAGVAERQIAQFIENDQVGMGEAVGEASLPGVGLFLLKRIDQFDRREEADPAVMVDDRLDAESSSEMGLAGAGATDELGYLPFAPVARR